MRFLLVFLIAGLAQASTVRFDFRDAAQRDIVIFTSQASLERIVGINPAIFGYMDLDPENLNAGVKGKFEVDLRQFQTGLQLRDAHFRERYDTASFPLASFDIEKLVSSDSPKLVKDRAVKISVKGTLLARNKSVPLTVELRLYYVPASAKTSVRNGGNLLRLSGEFPLALADIGMNVPAEELIRIAKSVRISVHAVGSDAEPPGLTVLPDGEKKKEK